MKKRTNFLRSILSVVVCLSMLVGLVPAFGLTSVALSTNVSTYAQLVTALENSEVDEVIVTATITLPDGAEIYGNGKTVRAQTTGVDEQGIVQTGSNYNVFKTAANATVHIYDMVIMGGSVTAVVNETGKLYLDNVTITRSGSEDNPGGGIVNGVQNLRNNKNQSHKTAYVVMTNSSIVRNVACWGGGFMNYGTLIMDGCSLSENRSINTRGGGGAGENEGYAYLNNCTVANNTSSEIGGGINICKGGELYVMNCTFTGNVTYNNTSGGQKYGGAVGVNDGCIFKAVNSIFANNYYINKNTETVTPCDIGMYNSNNITAYNSIIGTVAGGTPSLTDCSNDTDGLFAAYITGNVLAGDGTESTADFSKPAVVQNASGELYTPISGDYQGEIEGVPTYFDYSDLDNIRMYFTDDDGNDATFFAGSGTEPTDIPVDNALDDTDRDTTLIGSSNSLGEGKTIYTIKVVASQHGSIKGGTIYGDSYIVVSDGSVVSVEEIVTVTLEATPDNGYYFNRWELLEGGSESGELAQLSAEIEALQAQATKITDAVAETTEQKEDVEANIGDADKTSLWNVGNKRTLVTDTNTLVTTLNGYKTSFSEYSNVVSTITSANLSTKNYNRNTKYSTWCNNAVNTATSVITLLNAHLVDVRAQLVAKQAEYDAAVAAANAETGINTGNNPMEFVVNRNISLRAEFVAQAPDYTVTFHSNTEPETTVTQTFAAGHYTANLTANTFTNDGQPFLGWALVYCGDVVYADGASFTASGNADLYARWGYTVDYNANGGRNVPDSQIKDPGKSLNLSSVAPTRDGYTFKGWGLSADASDAVLQPGDVYGVDKNITLYAIWEELKVPTVLNTTLPDGYLNVPYSGSVETDQDAIFILADGSTLPDGLTIGKDGTITGTPTSTGTYTFDITVYNKDDISLNNSSTITISITISDPKSALQDLVDQANAVDQDDYTPETAQNLQDAIDEGQSVLDDDDATTSEINEAIEALQDALNQLALDKSALAAAIAQGNAITDDATEAAKYTADSLAVLEDALNVGEIVYANTKATAEQIAQATQAILDAINSLTRNIDKDALQDLVDEANAIDQDDYTDDTADDLQDAIDAAQAVLDDPDATDEEIRDAYEALEDAINNLKPDKTELENAINEGNDVLGGDTDVYTPASVQALENAVAAGEAVDADPDATVAEIEAATEAIRDALNNLLEEAVENAENTDTTGMTPESVQDLEDAIDNANDVINNSDSTPEEIADAIQAIEDAINGLTPDKSELEQKINEGKNTDTTGMTPESVQALEDAIDAAEDVLNDPDATVEEIQDAIDAIEDAINGLTPDKSELEEKIEESENTDTTGMTPESVQALEDAITAGENVLNDPDATVEEIQDAIDAIEDAINGLTPDKTDLEEAITEGNTVLGGDTSVFTSESVDALENAVAAGETVYADPDATVEEIAEATQAIKDALEGLLEQIVDDATDIIGDDADAYTDESIDNLQDAIDAAQDVINNPGSTPEEIADAIQAVEDAINALEEITQLIPTTDGGIVVDRTDTDYYYLVGLDSSDTTFASVKAKLENDGRQVIAFRGETQLGDSDHIGTGCVIKCVSVKDPSIVYEQATVILYGDVNGDGLIDSVDYDAMFNETLFGEAIEGDLFRIAGDIYHDGVIDGFDMSVLDLQIMGAKLIDQSVEYYK